MARRQRTLLAGDAWIIDGNYNETLALRLERAETVIFSKPWWLCASRAFVRGLRKPAARCPRAARTRSSDACATSGAALGGYGATAVQNLSTRAPRSRGTGLTHGHVLRSRQEGGLRCRLNFVNPWAGSPLQQSVRLVGGWDVAHRGEQLSSLAQRRVGTGCAEGEQAASLAEQRVRELRYVALAPLRGRLGISSRSWSPAASTSAAGTHRARVVALGCAARRLR